MRKYLVLIPVISILVGIILALAPCIKDLSLIAICFNSIWFLYAVLMLVTTFLIKPGLRIKASRQNEVTVIRYELLNTGEKKWGNPKIEYPMKSSKKSFPEKSKEVWAQNGYTAN